MNNRIVMVDMYTASVHRWCYPTSALQEPLKVEESYLGSVVPREKGGLVVAAHHKFKTLDEKTGGMTTIDEVYPDEAPIYLNDGKCDALGRMWTGSMHYEGLPKQGALFVLHTNGEVETKIKEVGIGNGLAWSADNSTMYFIDSLSQNVTAYKFDLTNGNISDPRVLVEFDSKLDGMPDGQTIDTDGNLWVTMYGGGRVIKIDTTLGKKVERYTISHTALKTTSCCFGGPNMDELFVTSALNTSDDCQPVGESGSLFKVTGLGVKGTATLPYKG